jgi:transposase-like protein
VPCPFCGGDHEVVEHASVTGPSGRLREAKLRCRKCGSARSLFFRLPVPN